MKKSLLLIAGMFALTAAAQETTEPAFVAEALDGKTITLQCASGSGQTTNGYYMMINGTTLTAAANPGTNPYKWLVEYDPEEQGMILSSGGYYIGRVPNSAKDANSKYFTLTQDKELAGRYRLYPNNDITSDDIQRYCLTATKFVNGTTIETISKFGGGTDNTANHWMQCDVNGNSAHITRWGSPANNSKWTYTEVAPVVEGGLHYMPVTYANQIVDGGKYVIAAYNHTWPGDNKRYLVFDNNTSKFNLLADATEENAIWTADTISNLTCASTAHNRPASNITLHHNGQYLNPPTSGTPTNPATAANNDPATTKLEIYSIAKPNTAASDNYTYFKIDYDYVSPRFTYALCIHKEGNFNRNSLSSNTALNNLYETSTRGCTTYYLVWHVIENEDDLAKHAEGYIAGRTAATATLGEGVGLFHLYSPEISAMIAKKGSTVDITQEQLDAFTEAVGNIQTKLNMPKPGMYFTFKGHANIGTIQARAVLYYTTEKGTGGTGSTRMTVDKTHNSGNYTDDKAIMYLEDENTLLSYSSGYYLGVKNTYLFFNSDADMVGDQGSNEPATIQVVAGTSNQAAYQINYLSGNTKYGFHINGASSSYWFGDHCTASALGATTNHNQHDWIMTQVNELPTTLGADGSGSFYAPVAVSFPSSVTVYAAKVSDLDIRFSIVDPGTVIAPGTPVILTGTPNTTVNATIDYNYQPSTEPAVLAETTTPTITFYGTSAVAKCPETTGMRTFKPTAGSTDDQNVTLTEVESGTCLPVHTMLMSMPDDCPLVSTGENGAKTVTLKLNQENYTTGIREIETDRTGNAADAIYNLQGRRLSAPARGINIINGKKILVK